MQPRTASQTCVTPGSGLNRINRILISISCNFFSGSRSPKNSEIKRAWPGAIWGWVTDREVIPGCARSVQKRHVLVCEGSLCPRKLSEVSGPGLGEAGRYNGDGQSGAGGKKKN